jgi:hypothetical protein
MVSPELTPFFRAKEVLDLVTQAHGFRFAGIEVPEETGGNAFAEYVGRGRRLRLVWEGAEKALWVDTAREIGAQIVSRWVDIEGLLAGESVPISRELGDARMEEIAAAVHAFLLEAKEQP